MARGLLDDPALSRSMLLPFGRRTYQDYDDDVSEYDRTEFALPSAIADPLGRGGLLAKQALTGQRMNPNDATQAMIDVGMLSTPIGLLGGVPKGAIGMNVFDGGIHDLGKLGKEYLMRRYGYGDGDIYPEMILKADGTYGYAPLTQAQKNRASKHGDDVSLNLSTNRNDDKSAYLSGPFGEFRISDHYNNPNFNLSHMNATNPSAKEVVESIDDAMGRVNKSRLEVQTKLDEYEIPLNKIKAKLGKSWEDDLKHYRRAGTKTANANRKAEFIKKHNITIEEWNFLVNKERPKYVRQELRPKMYNQTRPSE